jgi:S-DNA-T family DNA segregation ATPase FtsK/SpoIIIE
MGLGYARAARMLDILESKGIIGPGDGAKPRQVYIARDGTPAGGSTASEPAQPSVPESEV